MSGASRWLEAPARLTRVPSITATSMTMTNFHAVIVHSLPYVMKVPAKGPGLYLHIRREGKSWIAGRCAAAHSDPRRYISPEGFARPPAGSRVTAAAVTAPRSSAEGVATTRPVPVWSGVKSPALTGPTFSVMSQTWYYLPAGGWGRPKA